MDLVVCPHCNSHRLVSTKIPKDVVVVMPCPACSELVVMFRKKVIALDRKILESGSKEERKLHLAEIIAEFLEPGMFRFNGLRAIHSMDDLGDDDEGEEVSAPISDKEFERFTRYELDKIDDRRYFRRHFD